MYAANRRQERKQHVIDRIRSVFDIKSQIDLSKYESKNIFLEGTGSMVLDRDNKIAYACLSPRTDKKVLDDFCKQTGYKPVSFRAIDIKGREIYHTNVMMCVADRYVVFCLDSIEYKTKRVNLIYVSAGSGKQIRDINFDHMIHCKP